MSKRGRNKQTPVAGRRRRGGGGGTAAALLLLSCVDVAVVECVLCVDATPGAWGH